MAGLAGWRLVQACGPNRVFACLRVEMAQELPDPVRRVPDPVRELPDSVRGLLDLAGSSRIQPGAS